MLFILIFIGNVPTQAKSQRIHVDSEVLYSS